MTAFVSNTDDAIVSPPFLHLSAFIGVHQRLKLRSSRRSPFRLRSGPAMEIPRCFICFVLGRALHFAQSLFFEGYGTWNVPTTLLH